jgi:hypothetical protein
MDVAPGFAEPGRRIKTGQGKKGFTTHDCTSTGVFSFGDFSLDKQRKVTRLSHAVAGETISFDNQRKLTLSESEKTPYKKEKITMNQESHSPR